MAEALRTGDTASQCLGKEGFVSAHLAWKVAKRRARIRRTRDSKDGEPYRCPICGHWHIGALRKTAKPGSKTGMRI